MSPAEEQPQSNPPESGDARRAAFRALLERLRLGDEAARTEFWQRYMPVLRNMFQVRARRKLLSPVYSSQDLMVSVFNRFFQAIDEGKYDELNDEAALLRLLRTIADRRLKDEWRKCVAGIRDRRRHATAPEDGWLLPDDADDPVERAVQRELLARFEEHLTAAAAAARQKRLKRTPADDSPSAKEYLVEIMRALRDGRSREEIAEMTGLSKDSAIRAFERERDAFLKQIAADWGDD